MLLSVIVYNHKLTKGQWFGTGVVFAGISVEAWVKRRGTSTKKNPAVPHPRFLIPINYYRCSCEEGHPGKGKGEDQIIMSINHYVSTSGLRSKNGVCKEL